MLENSAIAITTFATLLALVCVWSLSLAFSLTWTLKLQSRTISRALQNFLSDLRLRHFYSIGLNPSKSRLSRMVRREAAIFLGDEPWDVDSRSRPLARWYPPGRLSATVEEAKALMPDLNDLEYRRAIDGIDKLRDVVIRRLAMYRRVLLALFAAPVCVMFGLDAVRLPMQIYEGTSAWDILLVGDFLSRFGELRYEPLQGVGYAVSAILVAIAAGKIFDELASRLDTRSARVAKPRLSAVDDGDPGGSGGPKRQIGRDGDAIRALTFAGGAFDTVMQLGVAHAFCVSQAKAPDAVVGLSAGSIHAVALAEVLQAGEGSERETIEKAAGLSKGASISEGIRGTWWKGLSSAERASVQKARLLARANRLRFFIEYAQRSPEMLFDALTPGSYQPNSFHPLQALQQPRFSREERLQKEDAIVARSGLVRLYNDVLNVPLAIGAITRFVRRILGMMAAAEIPNRTGRYIVRFVEFFRLTILAGSRLLQFSPLVAILLRSLRKPRTYTATAGTLISRSQLLTQLGRFVQSMLAFVALLHLWVLISGIVLVPIAIPVGLLVWKVPWVAGLLAVLLALGAVCAVLALGQQLSPFEREDFRITFSASLKDCITFVSFVIIWSVVLIAVHGSIHLLIASVRSGSILNSPILSSPVAVLIYSSLIATGLLLVGLIALAINIRSADDGILNRILRSYSLGASLLSTHELGTFLSTLFDKNFYPTSGVDDIVEASLNNQRTVSEPKTPKDIAKRRIAHYEAPQRLEPIAVGTAAADVATGELRVLPSNTPVVTALLAATSYTPVFPPTEVDDRLFVDGIKVTSEPTSALFRMLRSRVNENSSILHLYNVVPFPMSSPELSLGSRSTKGGKQGIFVSLVDIVVRALRLQRYRDATIERRLTELFNRAIPADEFVVSVPDRKEPGHPKRYLRSWVTPIERETGDSVTARVVSQNSEDRRSTIAETIADGCRAALQVMIHDDSWKPSNPASAPASNAADEKKELADGTSKKGSTSHVCRDFVKDYLERRQGKSEGASVLGQWRLPGSSAKDADGPGLPEICLHCRLTKDRDSTFSTCASQPGSTGQANPAKQTERSRPDWKTLGPTWPHEREYSESPQVDSTAHFELKESDRSKATKAAMKSLRDRISKMPKTGTSGHWPVCIEEGGTKGEDSDSNRPTVSMLFGGGVFRGVYQLGVLSGLSQVNLRPDVVAGASVGSITAAMVATAFSKDNEASRNARTARLAAVYLAVDRLILTDRFSDFVRDFTLRASESRFSVRQVDRLLRKYDYPSFKEFDDNARRVAAGLERLLYIDPFQLISLIRSTKSGDNSQTLELLREVSQVILDRSQVGIEALGSEPLQLLIDEYVSGDLESCFEVGPTFDDFREKESIQFLATATNLTQGLLEVFGSDPVDPDAHGVASTILSEGLLASSAFPGVFRPRWAWEVQPDLSNQDQYTDGGNMDNLPLDAVANFLNEAAAADLIKRRPRDGKHPHLVIAASLEVNAKEFKLPTTRAEFKRNWLLLSQRNSELKYNSKLDGYAGTQQALQEIARKKYRDDGVLPKELLNLEVLSIKPDWLCGTFAFHPMLGFRRKRQKENIAHGCAGTLITLAEREKREGVSSISIYRGRKDELPKVTDWAEAFARLPQSKADAKAGKCWLRDRVCPFSKAGLATSDEEGGAKPLPDRTRQEVADIYKVCKSVETHLRRI